MVIINKKINYYSNKIVGKTKYIKINKFQSKLLINEIYVSIYLYNFYKKLWYFKKNDIYRLFI